jgi:hypothetical protein
MVTLTTSIKFLLLTFAWGAFYEGSPHVRQLPKRWSTIAESLRNADLECVD